MTWQIRQACPHATKLGQHYWHISNTKADFKLSNAFNNDLLQHAKNYLSNKIYVHVVVWVMWELCAVTFQWLWNMISCQVVVLFGDTACGVQSDPVATIGQWDMSHSQSDGTHPLKHSKTVRTLWEIWGHFSLLACCPCCKLSLRGHNSAMTINTVKVYQAARGIKKKKMMETDIFSEMLWIESVSREEKILVLTQKLVPFSEVNHKRNHASVCTKYLLYKQLLDVFCIFFFFHTQEDVHSGQPLQTAYWILRNPVMFSGKYPENSNAIHNVNKNFWIVHGIKVPIAVQRVTIRKFQP